MCKSKTAHKKSFVSSNCPVPTTTLPWPHTPSFSAPSPASDSSPTSHPSSTPWRKLASFSIPTPSTSSSTLSFTSEIKIKRVGEMIYLLNEMISPTKSNSSLKRNNAHQISSQRSWNKLFKKKFSMCSLLKTENQNNKILKPLTVIIIF